jgi:hypothetical protein
LKRNVRRRKDRIASGSYELLTSIIKGFLNAGAEKIPISTKVVASYTGRHPTVVSQNIRAIEFMGIVSRKGITYILTKEGSDLAYSIEYGDEEGISSAFRSLVYKNDFLKSVVFSVKSRGSVSNFQLRDEIGKRAKVTKKDPRSTIGAQAVIDILVISRLLEKEGENLVATERAGKLREGVEEVPSKFEVKRPPLEVARYPLPEKMETPMQIHVRLDFQVPAHPAESDIKEIADAIRKIRNYLAHPQAKEEE